MFLVPTSSSALTVRNYAKFIITLDHMAVSCAIGPYQNPATIITFAVGSGAGSTGLSD